MDILGKYTTADIVASFIALSRLQSLAWKSQQRQQFTKLEPWDGGDARCSPILASSQHDFSSGGNQGNTNTDVESDNRALVQELAHYVVYANAAYGWSMDLATRQRVNIGGDTQTLLRQMNGWITRSDIVMAKWQSKAHRPAYFIVRDRKQKTVVLCIRGTWSARDLLTDLCCLPRDFESAVADDGCLMNDKNDATVLTRSFAKSTSAMFSRPRRHRGHMGMLEAARALQADCEATIAIELEKNPGYSLVLVGHSLGGGCAALLGTLWEQRHPTLRVYAFGPPCVAPANAQWHANIVSVVTDGDPFGRLSLGHIVDVTTALARLCEDPLLRNDILWRTNDDNGSAMSSSSSVLHPRATEEQHDLEDWCRRTMETTLRHSMTAEKLYPPGRVLLVSVAKAARAKVTMHPGQWWNWWMRREMPLPAPFSYPLRRHHPTAVVTLREVSAVEHFRELILFRRPGMMMMMDLTRHIPAHYISALTALAAVTPGCAAASFPASSAL